MAEGITKAKDGVNRCQANYSNGQCPNEAATGSKYCKVHGGAKNTNIGKRSISGKTSIYSSNEHTRFMGHKGLAEEVALLRNLLDILLTTYKNDIIGASVQISDMILKIERVVLSCSKLEQKESLTKDELDSFVGKVLAIITQEVKDPAILGRISHRISSMDNESMDNESEYNESENIYLPEEE